jgi:signal transduction histidine kinase
MNPIELIQIATILVALSYLIAAMLALLLSPRRPNAARAFSVFAVISFVWSLSQLAWDMGWFPNFLDAFVLRLPMYALLIVSAAQYIFTAAFVGAKHRLAETGFSLLAGFGLALSIESGLIPIPETLLSGDGWAITRSDLILGAIAAGWGFYMGASTFVALRFYRHPLLPAKRNRFKYLAIVLPLALLGDIFFFRSYWILGSVVRLGSAWIGLYATLAKRPPEMKRAVSGSISYLIRIGIWIGFYAAVLKWSQALFLGLPNDNTWLVIIAIALGMAVLFHPLLMSLQRLFERLLAGSDKNRQRILREYSQNISNILDIQLLAGSAIEMICAAFGAQSGYLFLVDHDRDSDGSYSYRLRKVKLDEDTIPQGFFREHSPLTVTFREEHNPLTQHDIDVQPLFTSLSEEERAWMNALQTDIFIPVHAKEEWIGLLALGPKLSGVPYTPDEKEMLSTMGAQTAVALENARLVEGLMRLNSEFRRAYKGLDEANRRLERLDRIKTDFISIASHELRTPLTLLEGYTQILFEDPKLVNNPSYARMIKGIHEGSQRLHEIVESMLDMAKIDSQDLELVTRPVSLPTMIAKLEGDIHNILAERNQRLIIEDLNNLPAIEADPDAIRKVFYHLIINAIKYTPDGGRITVSGRALLPTERGFPKGGVEMLVQDTGVGIDPSLHELVFIKFYQTGKLALHSSGRTKFKGGGPGLGLAIARGIVEAHQGKIWVESSGYDEKRCPGSSFYVALPLLQAPARSGENPLTQDF